MTNEVVKRPCPLKYLLSEYAKGPAQIDTLGDLKHLLEDDLRIIEGECTHVPGPDGTGPQRLPGKCQ